MRKSIQILLSFLFLFIFSNYCYAKTPVLVKMAKGEARITVLEGYAQAFFPGQKDSRKLKVNDLLKAGCDVATGEKSRMELLLPDNTIVRFAENTRFVIKQIDVADVGKRNIKIFVPIGKVWSNVRKALGSKGVFEVSCQNAVAGVRGTIYQMSVENDKSALVIVYDGEVNVAAASNVKSHRGVPIAGPPRPIAGPTIVEGPKTVSLDEWVYIVKSMQQIRINSNGQAEKPKEFTEAEDKTDWADWNKARDNDLN